MPDMERDERAVGFSEMYDRESDTYYLTFNTGEPSYCVEADDVLLIEVGLFSNLPTGFRILNFSKSNARPVELTVARARCDEIFRMLSDRAGQRKAQLEEALEKVVA